MKPPPAKRVPFALLGAMGAGGLIVTYTTPMLILANTTACAASWVFVFFYATRVKWERSLTGWNMMTLATALAGLTSVGVTRRVLGDGADQITAATYVAVAFAAIWTILTIRRVQAEPKDRLSPAELLEAAAREADEDEREGRPRQ